MGKVFWAVFFSLFVCGSLYADSMFLYTDQFGNQTVTFGHING